MAQRRSCHLIAHVPLWLRGDPAYFCLFFVPCFVAEKAIRGFSPETIENSATSPYIALDKSNANKNSYYLRLAVIGCRWRFLAF